MSLKMRIPNRDGSAGHVQGFYRLEGSMKAAPKLFSIKQSEIFDSFNPVELGRLLGILEELELPKHHMLFSPGAPSEAIYFIEKGRVRLTRLSTEGKTVIL